MKTLQAVMYVSAAMLLSLCLPAVPLGMALSRTVKDELLAATHMLRTSGEDDQSYWKRVVERVLNMREEAVAAMSPDANDYLSQFFDDRGKPKRDMFGPGSPSIQTPDDYNDYLLQRGSAVGSAPSAFATNPPLANVGVGSRISVETENKGTLEGVVKQNTTEFLALEVDGQEEILRVIDIKNHAVLDDGTGTTQRAGPAGGYTPNTGGDKQRQREARDTAAAKGEQKT